MSGKAFKWIPRSKHPKNRTPTSRPAVNATKAKPRTINHLPKK